MFNKGLYIGQYTTGTTSRMRAEALGKYFNEGEFYSIDTNIPFYKTSKVFRTIGFRYKLGPLIKAVNSYILKNLPSKDFEVIWIDKGVYLKQETLKLLKERSELLLHYTPDAAFFQNKSSLFEGGLGKYDFVITTKSFELEEYFRRVEPLKVILTSQGYNPGVHKPYNAFEEKEREVVFVGLCEPSREEVVEALLSAGISVTVVGYGWKPFVSKNIGKRKFLYLGEKISGTEYGRLLSSAKFGLGLLSKRFPERHTTRTFEIPACRSLLLTEKNEEISNFFEEDEVVYFQGLEDLIQQIKHLLVNKGELEKRTIAGYKKVQEGAFDYSSLLGKVLEVILQKR